MPNPELTSSSPAPATSTEDTTVASSSDAPPPSSTSTTETGDVDDIKPERGGRSFDPEKLAASIPVQSIRRGTHR